MKEIENDGFSDLSHEEMIRLTGGSDPGDLLHDIGFVVGKIGGWIKNAFTADTRDQWMLDVDPKTLFG